ncbi:hypothetical protein VNO77_05487 [Canavalia gladiata]|uniref:DUF7750 domain-containing protein n=1 Tax=Canavalia gladiata TaxID=3824 RepID=A0AAN9R8P9_CANGL
MLLMTVTSFLPAKTFRPREFRVFRRRRFKINASLPIPPSPAPFENLFHSLIAQYPSVNALDFITPALGFASGVALFFSRFKSTDDSALSDIGQWILFASPTPFNRFVLLRCPSISFLGSNLLEDVSERLVREERHYVSINSGRIQVRKRGRDLEDEKELNYQRVCVSAADGGVVSLDWPANLDLEQERGLDSTLLLVPGTPQGSMDGNIRFFVLEALKRGFFPVVMNPRGCAASPLTTPRRIASCEAYVLMKKDSFEHASCFGNQCGVVTCLCHWTVHVWVLAPVNQFLSDDDGGWVRVLPLWTGTATLPFVLPFSPNQPKDYLFLCLLPPTSFFRLFTAADSDDICTAITYINNARPWTTLMSVGWGYGANMLTKYLAEVGERTPLAAATCIDNPFDLDEATRSSPYHIVTDQKLTGGLIDILQTNKALFQGKTKGFDVEKALLAKSVRDFEEAISMISYGFGDIEDFYSKSSTRNMIRDVKIPVLFIQSDDGMVPIFSVPRNLIAENPFTSLLLCSCLPSSATDTDMSALSWCQLLTIEWLTAVEVGLLKGRHPLLTDIDVTINPSKGVAVVEDIRSDKDAKVGKLLDLTRSNAFNGYSIDPTKDLLEEKKDGSSFQFRSQQDLQRNFKQDDMSLQVKNGPLQQTSSSDTDSIKEENTASVDSEHGQVLQTAQVVINMLDATMPGTLTEEKKKKVEHKVFAAFGSLVSYSVLHFSAERTTQRENS